MSDDTGLVYVGKIISLDPIPGADFIVCATVGCGKGGKWRGVVRKSEFNLKDICTVFLPDSLIPEREDMKFMESSNWRVRMRRFKGAPSEVVIIPYQLPSELTYIGADITPMYGVTKYYKPVPANLQGEALGEFPSFIPKTDEPNYQSAEGIEYVEKLHRKPYYITEKADGSSTTAYRYKDHFGVCSRNWELVPDEKNGYWEIAYKYKIHEKLPEGIAIQWETCGPKIQSNPMRLSQIEGFAFSAYDIPGKKYFTFDEFVKVCTDLKFPMVPVIAIDDCFYKDGVETLGEGIYSNGIQREGVVVRSTENLLGHKPISFKVINLNYEK